MKNQPLHLPISLDDQEVLCSNCYETIHFNTVNQHSETCFKEQKKAASFEKTVIIEDTETEFNENIQVLNERI